MHVTALSAWTLRVDPDGPSPIPPEAAALGTRRIPGHAPGAVHGDLLDAGLIPDPFLDEAERAVAWVGRTDWVYECSLPAMPAAERVDLAFDGLDTVARIGIDGAEVGRSCNMHRRYRYDVGELLGYGSAHRLAVHLSSAYTWAEAEQARMGARPNAYPEPFNFIRMMACSFGWDWGPTIVGAGIWRPARLEAWSGARIAEVRPLVDIEGGTGRLTALVDVERAASLGRADLSIELRLDDEIVATAGLLADATDARIDVLVPDVRPWNPAGYGSAERYRLDVTLWAGDRHLDSWSRRIGFRRLDLDRSVDEVGSRFVFRINDRPVLVKGVNWIPDDVLPGRMTRERYAHRLQQAADANVNLIRVWGGGSYEDDSFYDTCDELGLLVWQDFPFACAAYPEEEPLRSEVLAEARDNVARLASHPSLVLWNGNNENLWLHGADRWAQREGGTLTWGERYYLEDLPAVVAEVDPSRPYSAGSPWSGSWAHEPNDPVHQTFHSWEVWNRQDYLHYRDSAPRFVAEFGWQAPPAWRTLRDAVTDEPITPDSPGVAHHQKAIDGNEKLARGLAAHFPPPTDVHSWHYLTQLNQVRAIETGITHWRSHWPRTAGTILWQLNDLWPVISWAAIDGAGRRKPLYHALKALYRPRLLTFQPGEHGPELCVLNDSDAVWAGHARVYRAGDAGILSPPEPFAVRVAPRSVSRFPVSAELVRLFDPARQVLVADLDGPRALWYGVEPKDTAFAGRAPEIAVAPTPDGLDITVTATTLLRDLLVQADRIHPAAQADAGFLTLLPGESATVAVSCRQVLDPESADAPFALTWLERVMDRVRRAG